MLSFLFQQPFQRSNTASQHPLISDNNSRTAEFLPPQTPGGGFCLKVTLKYSEHLRMKQQGIPSSHSPPYHWHWHQSEVFQVEKGAVIVTLEGKPHRITAADGPVTIPAGAYHTYEMDDSTEEDLVFLAWSPEQAGLEETFFRNLYSYLDDCQRNGVKPNMFQMLLLFHDYETSLALPGLPRWLGKVVSKWGLGFIGGKVIGEWLMGFKSSYKEYAHAENSKTD